MEFTALKVPAIIPGMRKRRILQALVITGGLAVQTAHAENDAANGEKLAREHCARCHVIGDYNRLGGIDSTPSFRILLTLPDADARFETFFVRRPHPVFVRMPDSPAWSPDPPNAAAFPFTLEDLSDLLAYVETLK